jgi:hypothetical protein
VKRSSPPNFLDWVRKAVRQEAKELWKILPKEKDPAKAKQVLERLISDPLMERVWDELYRKKSGKEGRFFNPACLTNTSNAEALREAARELRSKGRDKDKRDAEFLEFEAKIIEFLPDDSDDKFVSRQNEQDCAVRLFLSSAYRAALNTEPQFASEIQTKVSKLRDIARSLRELSAELRSIDIHVTEIYADKINAVAFDCDSDATVTANAAKSPWIVIRKRGDMRLKTFVARLSSTTFFLFKRPLYTCIANVANTVFNCQDGFSNGYSPARPITDRTVREILRDSGLRICPSFGPEIYPMFRARMDRVKAEFESSFERS